VVNGCSTRTTKPTLLLEAGQYSGPTSATLAPGASTVFKLTSQNVRASTSFYMPVALTCSAQGFAGIVYDAQNGTATSTSNLGFNFAASADGRVAQAAYVLSNYYAFSIPQVAVAWPSTQACATRRCYSSSCDENNAVQKGQSTASAIARATATCYTADTGITLYCTSRRAGKRESVHVC
jgi:hypothetical protein